jgi:hypothetical protein
MPRKRQGKVRFVVLRWRDVGTLFINGGKGGKARVRQRDKAVSPFQAGSSIETEGTALSEERA